MLKDNEYFHVSCYLCESVEDDYENGESFETCASWTGKDFPSAKMKFKSIKDALAQILSENCYDYGDPVEWMDFFKETGDEDERGRFDCDVLVDVDNTKASERQIVSWKKGETKLYNCHISARICVRSERAISDDELENSGI